MKVFVSAMLEQDFDAPQIFDFVGVVAVREFLRTAPRTGWAYDESTGGLVAAPVEFTVYDEAGTNVTTEAIALGWI
jgi:hypothetical protein